MMDIISNSAGIHDETAINVTFPPVTVAVGQQVDMPDGKRGTQPHYSRAEHFTFNTVDELAAALKAHKVTLPANPTAEDRTAAKRNVPYWTIGGLKSGGSEKRITGSARDDAANDVYRRKTANIAAANVIAIDMDKCGLAFYNLATMGTLLDRFSGVLYQTPSFTDEAPRVRILLTTKQPIAPEDKREIFTRFEYWFMQSIGAEQADAPHAWTFKGEPVVFDECMLKGNQVIYLPANNAEVFVFDGQPIDVDALPALPEGVKLRRSANDANYTRPEDLSDAAAWLLDNGHAEEHDAKTLNVLCPWHDEHTDDDGEISNGTVFKMDADPKLERFHCSHSHGDIINANQSAFARALGMPEEIINAAWGSVASPDDFDDLSTGDQLDTVKEVGKPFLSGVFEGVELDGIERDRLCDMNAEYVHTIAGGKNVVCQITRQNIGGNMVQALRYIRTPDLKEVFSSADPIRGYVTDADGSKKRGRRLNLAQAWLAWPSHTQKMGGVDFYPNPAKCPKDVYNLYTGLNVKAKAGDVAPYLDLVENIVCGGNKMHADYVLNYLAHMVQKPDEKPSVAIVMKGGRGIGKGSFVKPLIRILGMHAAHLTGAGQAAGRFNSVIVGKLLMFFDELHVTTRDAEDALKTIISEPVLSLERKGIDPEPVSNFARVIGASNHADVIRTGEKERRYMLLESSDHRAGDKAYWDQFYSWLNADGAAHLLAFLLARDISAFNPHFAPRTEALQQAMLEDLTPVNRFVLEQLRLAEPFARIGYGNADDLSVTPDDALPLEAGAVKTEEAAKLYLEWLNEYHAKKFGAWNIDHARHALRGVFNKVFDIKATGRKGAGFGRVYEVDSFDTLRHTFADHIGVDYAAAFGDDHD